MADYQIDQNQVENDHMGNNYQEVRKITEFRNSEVDIIKGEDSDEDEYEEEDKIADNPKHHKTTDENVIDAHENGESINKKNSENFNKFNDEDQEGEEQEYEDPKQIDVKHQPIPKTKNLLMMEKLEKEIDSIIHRPKPEDSQVTPSKIVLNDYETLASKDDDYEDDQPTLIIRQHLPEDAENKTPKLTAEDECKKRQTKPPVPRQPKLKPKKKSKKKQEEIDDDVIDYSHLYSNFYEIFNSFVQNPKHFDPSIAMRETRNLYSTFISLMDSNILFSAPQFKFDAAPLEK